MEKEECIENAAPIVQPVDPNAKITINAIDDTEVSVSICFF